MDPTLNMQISIPPLPQEYGYFYNKQDYNYTYLVQQESGHNVGCHFSSKQKKTNVPFLTCHGIITSIDKQIYNKKKLI